jgi:transcriptional regulator with XRE-family HTH domain
METESPLFHRKVIGSNLRRFRKAHMWTLEKLALRSDLSQDYLGRLERGTVNVGVDALATLAKVLKVKISDLLEGEEDER